MRYVNTGLKLFSVVVFSGAVASTPALKQNPFLRLARHIGVQLLKSSCELRSLPNHRIAELKKASILSSVFSVYPQLGPQEQAYLQSFNRLYKNKKWRKWSDFHIGKVHPRFAVGYSSLNLHLRPDASSLPEFELNLELFDTRLVFGQSVTAYEKYIHWAMAKAKIPAEYYSIKIVDRDYHSPGVYVEFSRGQVSIEKVITVLKLLEPCVLPPTYLADSGFYFGGKSRVVPYKNPDNPDQELIWLGLAENEFKNRGLVSTVEIRLPQGLSPQHISRLEIFRSKRANLHTELVRLDDKKLFFNISWGGESWHGKSLELSFEEIPEVASANNGTLYRFSLNSSFFGF